MKRDIEYIYEDDDILVCHKPAGIATEGAGVRETDLVSHVRNYLARKNRGQKGAKPPYVGTVYRLDKPVEGVVVIAKNKAAASDIAAQIKNHSTEKYYYALCYGSVPEDKNRLENLLVRREDNGSAMVITKEEANSVNGNSITLSSKEKLGIIGGDVKRAVLDYEVVKRDEDNETTLVRIKLLTGRFHQIRVQFAALGFPLLGDERYGSENSKAYSKEKGIKNVNLVCYKFGFNHPKTRKKVYFEISPTVLPMV
ncbi:RluA family pseudouridine synthase [Butyrivibrio sp. X503]|uniref:RluA family pseudouridine synthase n=1 Tax=Butyrivibrio sp. X503 TaxID=2364878 RepID=UPI000EBD212F|nr:RluA family pseudouridine synthase [Butyrivibrio sp. X503]RKM54958.1 RluA family pseudouridine synthase [Butyrivibrio sp. X503]